MCLLPDFFRSDRWFYLPFYFVSVFDGCRWIWTSKNVAPTLFSDHCDGYELLSVLEYRIDTVCNYCLKYVISSDFWGFFGRKMSSLVSFVLLAIFVNEIIDNSTCFILCIHGFFSLFRKFFGCVSACFLCTFLALTSDNITCNCTLVKGVVFSMYEC